MKKEELAKNLSKKIVDGELISPVLSKGCLLYTSDAADE